MRFAVGSYSGLNPSIQTSGRPAGPLKSNALPVAFPSGRPQAVSTALNAQSSGAGAMLQQITQLMTKLMTVLISVLNIQISGNATGQQNPDSANLPAAENADTNTSNVTNPAPATQSASSAPPSVSNASGSSNPTVNSGPTAGSTSPANGGSTSRSVASVAPAQSGDVRQNLVNNALRHQYQGIGACGGNGHNNAWCGDFITQVRKESGLQPLGPNASSVPGVYAWARQNNLLISASQLQPGDAVVMQGLRNGIPTANSHIGMYIGNGQVINGNTGGGIVNIRSLASCKDAKFIRSV